MQNGPVCFIKADDALGTNLITRIELARECHGTVCLIAQ